MNSIALERVKKIRSLITNALHPIELIITDDQGNHIGHPGAKSGKGYFTVSVKSTAFKNKTQLECHRLIYNALGDMMQTDIHALSITILN